MLARAGLRHRRWIAIALCAAGVVTGSGAVVPVGVAHADCTGAGDVGASSGCPPPGGGSGSGAGDAWPPTSVDWPPSQDTGGDDAGDAAAAKTPIVMPDGQSTPVKRSADAAGASTSAAPTPIVPVGAAPVDRPSPTAIVTPLGSTP
jgi:hypothetical protein